MAKTKFISISIVIIALLGFALVFASIIYLQTDHAQKIIQSQINAAIPGEMAWDHLRFAPFNGEIEISRLTIGQASTRTIVSVDKILLDIEWLPLIRRELFISKIEILGPAVNLERRPNGSLNLVEALSDSIAPQENDVAPKGKVSSPVNFIIKNFSLADGTVGYVDPGQSTDIKIDNINVNGDGNLFRQKGSLSINFSGDYVKINDVTIPINQFHLSGTCNKDKITLSEIKAVIPGTSATLKGHIRDISKTQQTEIQLAVSSDLSATTRAANIDPPLSGHVASQVSVNGPLGNPDAHLKLDLNDGVLFDIPVEKAVLSLDLKNRVAHLNELTIHAASGTSALSGNVDMAAAFPNGFLDKNSDLNAIAYDARLLQEHIRIQQLLKTPYNISGDVTGDVNLSGKGFDFKKMSAQADLDVSVKNFMSKISKDANNLVLNGKAAINHMILNLDGIEVSSRGILCNAKGKLNLSDETIDAGITLNAADIHPLFTSLGIPDSQGSMTVNSKVSGRLKQPAIDLSVISNQLAAGPVSLGDIKARAVLNPNGILDISEFNVKNQDAEVTGKGSIRIFDAPADSDATRTTLLTARLHNVDPMLFAPLADLSGTINGTVAIKTLLDEPDIRLQADSTNLQKGKYTIGDIKTDVHLAKGILDVKQVQVKNKNSRVQIFGHANIFEDQTFTLLKMPAVDLEIESDALFLNDFTEDAQGTLSLNGNVSGTMDDFTGQLNIKGDKIQARLRGDEKANELKGAIFAEVRASGALDNPAVTGTIKLTRLDINQKAVEDLSLDVNLKDHLALVSGSLPFPVDGRYNLSTKAFALNAEFNKFSLHPYFILGDKPHLGGKLSGDLRFSGTAGEMAGYKALLGINDFELTVDNASLISGSNIAVAMEDEAIQFRNFNLVFPGNGNLMITGKADKNDLAIKTNGRIPLSIAGVFVEDLADLSGQLSISAEISGSLKSPNLYGELNLVDISYILPYVDQKLHDTSAMIKFSPTAVVIEDLKGEIDDGRFNANGTMDLVNYQPGQFKFKLNADQMALNFPDTMDIVFNTDLDATGSIDKSAIAGELVIQEGLYYKDVKLDLLRNIVQKKRQVATLPKKQDTNFLANISLNIFVKHRQPFIVDNNLSYMEILPDLRIKGTAGNPIINGRTAVESGELYYQKKTFSITKGVIDFNNPYQTEASVDIAAEADIRNWKVLLDVSGTPEALDFKLSSTPYLEHSDIISLIIFGRTSSEMVQGEGGSNTSASQMLLQFMAGALNEDIQNATGFDIFETEVQSSENSDGGTDVKVTMGENLSKRMTVLYSVENTEGEVVQKATAEYKLLENLLFSSFQDNQNAFGGALKYKLEFW